MIRTNTIWAKIIIAWSALQALICGIENPDTSWVIQVPLNVIFFILFWIGIGQINRLRRECLEAKEGK